MLNIYLARHGQDEDNALGILNGHRNQSLTGLGVSQARKLAEAVKGKGLNFHSIYSSPLKRAQQTAEIIAETLGLGKPIILDNLIERDFGIMTGRKINEIEKICAPNIIKTETVIYFLGVEGAENFPKLLRRGQLVLGEIKERHQEGNILLVTHGDTGKMIYASYYDLDWKKVLTDFHFGNSDLLILSPDSRIADAHVFTQEQFNL